MNIEVRVYTYRSDKLSSEEFHRLRAIADDRRLTVSVLRVIHNGAWTLLLCGLHKDLEVLRCRGRRISTDPDVERWMLIRSASAIANLDARGEQAEDHHYDHGLEVHVAPDGTSYEFERK